MNANFVSGALSQSIYNPGIVRARRHDFFGLYLHRPENFTPPELQRRRRVLNVTAMLGAGTLTPISRISPMRSMLISTTAARCRQVSSTCSISLAAARRAHPARRRSRDRRAESAFQLMQDFLNLLLDPSRPRQGAARAVKSASSRPRSVEPAAGHCARLCDVLRSRRQPQPQDFEQRWSAWASGFGGGTPTAMPRRLQ